MQGMLDKGKAEKHDEQVQFAAYKQFCDSTAAEKQATLKKTDETIKILKANIQKHVTTSVRLSKDIADHDEDIAVWTGDSKAASKVRSIEQADYDATHKDYSESIDALERAVAILRKQANGRNQTSFTQLAHLKVVKLIPATAKKAIDAFLQQEPDEGLAVKSPESAGYEFQSQGVVEMLEKLLDKFVTERTELEKEEKNAKHAYDMLLQDLRAQIDEATQDRSDKSGMKAKTLQAKAEAIGDMSDATTTKDKDRQYLDDLVATCEQKAGEFQSRQQLRADEIETIEKAIDIISSKTVSDSAEKHLPTMLDVTALSLTQLGSDSLTKLRSDSLRATRARLTMYLRDRAQQINSRILMILSQRAANEPVQKLIKIVQDLIIRLTEEATAAAEHKGWCDTELSSNEKTRNQKTVAVESLHAEIDQLGTSFAKLTEDISELTKSIAEVDAAMADATKLRQEEKSKNSGVIKDAQEAQTAVAQAIVVLREFYAEAGGATSLIQRKHEAYEIFDAPYRGMQSENRGVVGMLEVIQSDFARLEADTESSEASSQQEYSTFMTDSKVDKEAKAKDVEHKSARKQDESQALTMKTQDLEATQIELDTAMAYYDKLKPSCIDASVSYEEREARRNEEIESLKSALSILEGETIA